MAFAGKSLEVIATSARRLSRLVNDILDFSKMKNGEIMLFKKNVDLYSLTQNAVILLENTAKGKISESKTKLKKNAQGYLRMRIDYSRSFIICSESVSNSLRFNSIGASKFVICTRYSIFI